MFEKNEYYEEVELHYGDGDNEVDRLKGYNKAIDTLKVCRINPEDTHFKNAKDKEEDQRRVLRRKLAWKKNNGEMAEQNKQMATILEAILYQQMDQNMIFGDIKTIRTCEFDDYFNGVDSIMQILNKKTGKYDYSAIAYDVAMSSDEDSNNLYKKLSIIEDNMKFGKLAYVKYFKSDEDPKMTSLDNVPKLIIGIDFRTLQNIYPLWWNDLNKQLLYNAFRFIILDQIILQIKYFIDYAQKNAPEEGKKYKVNGIDKQGSGKKNIISEYQKLLSYFEDLYKDKDMQSLKEQILSDPDKMHLYYNDNVLNFWKNLSHKK